MSEKGTEGGDGITDAHEISGRLCTSKSGKGNRDWRTKSPSPPHAGMQAGRVMAGMLMMPGPLSGSDLGPLEVTLWKVIARERHEASLFAGRRRRWGHSPVECCKPSSLLAGGCLSSSLGLSPASTRLHCELGVMQRRQRRQKHAAGGRLQGGLLDNTTTSLRHTLILLQSAM